MGLYHTQKEQMITNAKKFYTPLAVSSSFQDFGVLLRLLDLQLMSDLVCVLFTALFVYSISNGHNDLSCDSSSKYLYDLSKLLRWFFLVRHGIRIPTNAVIAKYSSAPTPSLA